ncbi:MAG: hypothetical protein K6F37_04365 [Lachnospiraceae bacterium]|nr:hypothetical protein [Lachnospiraceae bacterium]
MQSTNIIGYHKDGFYGCTLMIKPVTLAMKIDTGSPITLISVEKISGVLTDEQIKALKAFLNEKKS